MGIVQSYRSIFRVLIQKTKSYQSLQNMLYFQINSSFCYQSLLYSRHQEFFIQILPRRHFQIQTMIGRSHCRIHGNPIRHQDSFKSPCISQYINIQPAIFACMYPIQQIITIHHSSYMGLFHCFPERCKINFLQSALIYFRTDMVAIPFLVVSRKMLDCGNHTFRLHS